jgi:hypothetical protein
VKLEDLIEVEEAAKPPHQSVYAMAETKFITRSICVSHEITLSEEAVNKAV